MYGDLTVSAGASNDPYVFTATDSSYGLTSTANLLVGTDSADGYLHIKSGKYAFKQLYLGDSSGKKGWLKVGDGSSVVSLMANGGNPTFRGASEFAADKATLDFSGRNFNMYNTSSANIKDSTTTAGILNVAVDANNNCSVAFDGGSLTLAASSDIGYGTGSTGGMYATNLTLNADGNVSLRLGGHDAKSTGAKGTVDKKGGDWTIGGSLYVGAQDNSTGDFTTDGGSVEVKGDTYIAAGSGSTGVLAVSNGEFSTKSIQGTGMATLAIDGGTLKALQAGTFVASGMTATVGANGGTIDSGGFAIALSASIGGEGGMTFKGGGTVTLSATPSYTGGTTIETGTALKLVSASKPSILANLVVAIPESGAMDGATVLEMTDGGTFTAEEVAAMNQKLSGNTGNRYALESRDEGAKVVVVDTQAGEYTWNGGNSGAGWKTAGMWTKDGVSGNWYDSTAAVFANAGDSATVDSDVTAASVTFRENATVDGSATLTPGTVAVSDGVEAVINAPTAGALEKTGPGTLTLGSSRTEQTTLSEGTLVMGAGTSLDWSKLVLGADAARLVVLEMDAGAELAIPNPWFIGANEDNGNIVPTTKVYKKGGDWTAPGGVQIGRGESATVGFYNEGGKLEVNGNFDIGVHSFGKSALLEISGGMVTNAAKYVHLGANSPATMNVRTGGKYGVANATYGLIVGGHAAGTLNVEGAGSEVFVDGPLNLSFYGGDATVVVSDNGVLTFNEVNHNTEVKHNTGESGGTAKISLDGGTIRANTGSAAFIPAKDNMEVFVKSCGGTIDANGMTITIAEPFLGDAESPGGGMSFKGGGVVTLAAGNTYTGATTVELGTTVHIPSASALAGKVNVSIPATAPADGVYRAVAIDGEGTLAASILEGVEPPEDAALRLSGDGKYIFCIYGNPVNTWIGGASGSLSDATNWSRGTVPTAGESCIIGNATAATLTVGNTFAPASITFPVDAALVTINAADGETLSGVASIANNSSQHHVFNCKVVCADGAPALPMLAANYVSFPGGIDAKALAASDGMVFHGKWHVDGGWNLGESTAATVKSGSSLVMEGTLINAYGLTVEDGATLTVANVQVYNADKYFLKQNSGTLVVENEMILTMTSSKATKYHLGGLFDTGGQNAVTRVYGIVNSSSTQDGAYLPLNNASDSVENTIVMGAGGLSFRDCHRTNKNCYPYFQVDSGKSVVLESSADWSIAANTFRSGGVSLEIQSGATVTVNTTDYDGSSIARTVRAIGIIGNRGTLVVKGIGTMTIEGGASANTIEVQESATLSVTPGKNVKTVEVASGAALGVAGSGTVAFSDGGSLALADNATLKFNFTERDTAPVLNLSGKTVSFGSGKSVKVSVGGVRPASGGTYPLTSGGGFADASVSLSGDSAKWAKSVSVDAEGNIVLAVRKGFCVIVR